jgi:hypothetical protein
LLDSGESYVTFGGNGKKSRRGRGYQIIGRRFGGWLSRAGYRRAREGDTASDDSMVGSFITDLARLAEDLDLVVVGYHPAHPNHKWRGIEELKQCLRTAAGREWLAECTLRIYAPSDYLIRWRYFFSKKLGFRWIPRTVDDTGPGNDIPEPDDGELRRGDQVRQWLKLCGFTQSRLAEILSDLLKRTVSRQRVNRLVDGRVQDKELYFWVNELRRAKATDDQCRSGE